LNLIIPLLRTDSASNQNPQPLVTGNVNCGVMFHLCRATVLDLVVSLQVSFRSCQIFFMSGQKCNKTSCPIFVFVEAEEGKMWWNLQVQRQTNNIFDFGSEQP